MPFDPSPLCCAVAGKAKGLRYASTGWGMREAGGGTSSFQGKRPMMRIPLFFSGLGRSQLPGLL